MTGERTGRWLGGFLTMTAGLAVLSILSLVTMTYLNIRYAGEVDPWSRAESYYVFVGDGRRAFAISVVVLAAATVLVLVGMAGVGARVATWSAIWCASLTLYAIFPTDNGKTIVSTGGMVHQAAGAALFVSLPLAGRALAEHEQWARTARVLRWTAGAALALAAAYLATRLPDILPIPGMLDGREISGLVQRVLFGLETFLLFTLAVRLLRIAVAHPSPVRAEVPG